MSELRTIQFFVPGIPAPGGSKKGFVNPRTGRVIITEDCKRSKPWRAVVAMCAAKAIRGGMFTGPMAVWVTFFMPRPAGHYGTGKNAGKLRPSAPQYPTTKPDATKLWRATEDALTGIAWNDDSRIVDQWIGKRYAETTVGADITIRDLTPRGAE